MGHETWSKLFSPSIIEYSKSIQNASGTSTFGRGPQCGGQPNSHPLGVQRGAWQWLWHLWWCLGSKLDQVTCDLGFYVILGWVDQQYLSLGLGGIRGFSTLGSLGSRGLIAHKAQAARGPSSSSWSWWHAMVLRQPAVMKSWMRTWFTWHFKPHWDSFVEHLQDPTITYEEVTSKALSKENIENRRAQFLSSQAYRQNFVPPAPFNNPIVC